MKDSELPLLCVPESKTVWLGARCCVQCEGSLRILLVGGHPVLHWAAGDVVDERYAAVVAADSGAATIGLVLAFFELDDATLWRARQRVREGGPTALLPRKRGPKHPRKANEAVRNRVCELRRAGYTQMQIAGQLAIGCATVNRILKSMGLTAPRVPETREIPRLLEAASDASVCSHNSDSDVTAPAIGEADQVQETAAEALPQELPEPAASSSEAPEALPPQLAEPAASSSETAPPAPTVSVPVKATVAPSATHSDTGRPGVAAAAVASPLPSFQDPGIAAEAEVTLRAATTAPQLGLLLGFAVISATGLLDSCREVYGKLREGVYGLRTTVLVLVALAFLRRPRPEALKELNPAHLGRLLGLRRVPEVKTLRRKLAEIANCVGGAHRLVRFLCRRWLKGVSGTLAVLYIDGHVRVYHGKRRLSKAHVTQRNLSLRATTDYWVNGANGDPVLVMTAPANARLTTMLPTLLKEIEASYPKDRWPLIVFDRGGWKVELFRELARDNWRFLTYRKGQRAPHPQAGFSEHTVTVNGRRISYTLSECMVELAPGLPAREIAVLRNDGRQTIIVASEMEASAVTLAYRMFERWTQENFFGYMKQNFALDALVDYGSEPDDPKREIPNPERKVLDKEVATARLEVQKLQSKYGAAAADDTERAGSTLHEFQHANREVGERLHAARQRLAELIQRRKQLPKRVPVGEALPPEDIVRLSQEKKLFTDLVKAATYRAETMLLGLLRPHYSRADDEGRAFLRQAIQQSGDLLIQGDHVLVRFAPMSAPRYTKALQALCDEVNALEPVFPETNYRLRFEVAGPG